LVLQIWNVALAPAMAQLQDVAAVVAMHRFSDRTPERNAVVVINRGVVRDDASAWMHRNEGRDDGSDAPFCELQFPVDAGLRARPVVVVEPPEMFDRNTRFFTVRFLKLSGWNKTSAISPSAVYGRRVSNAACSAIEHG
jgi:hypothetical protein